MKKTAPTKTTKSTDKKVATKKPPGILKETKLFWYETMLLIRRFEERTGFFYGKQKIRGFCHMYNGQESCIVGAVTALKEGDKYLTAYRDHGFPIALGIDPKYVAAELFGKATGISKGRGGSMHLFDKEKHFFGGHAIVGGQIPLGVGVAFAEKYQKTDNVCITFMGDGAVRQGAFHEALNLAMLYQLPVIFVIENNGYSMGTSVERSSNVTELTKLASAYDMPAVMVNADHVENVHHAVKYAAERARKENIPTLIELKTYRYKGHSISDPAKYRTREEVESRRQNDPITLLGDELKKKKIASEKNLQAIDERVKQQVQEAMDFAEESPFPEAIEVYEHVYAQTDYTFLTS